jgi:hypothetical protein
MRAPWRKAAVQETAAGPFDIAQQCVPIHIGWYLANRGGVLCQNCVTCPPKPWGNTVIYGDTLEQIVVAGSR